MPWTRGGVPRLSDPHGGADDHVNLRDKLRGLLVRLYARRVEGHLDTAQVPKHIGVIMDGNRRWAKAAGSSTVHGHRAGADKIEEFLGGVPRLSDPRGGADDHVNLRDKLRGLLVRLYARRVEGHLDTAQVPKHIGVIMDGNRRWAKAAGSSTVHGHRAGADKIEEFLG